jgi:large subunit ribosomal protein L13
MEILIDAEDAIVGRVACYAAKQALNGHKVTIINAEKSIMTGSKDFLFAKYHHRMVSLGQPQQGPFISRMPDRFFSRIIRGMLPHKLPRGMEAKHRIRVFIGVPLQFKDKKFEKAPGADMAKLTTTRFVRLGVLCRLFGAHYR